MVPFRPEDHAMGLELQLEELNEQRKRAEVQGRSEAVARLDEEIGAVQTELAATAEVLAVRGPEPATPPRLHNAAELNRP